MPTDKPVAIIPPKPPSIRVYQPLLIDTGYVGEFGKYSTKYRQSSRLLGGWWQASWDMTLYPDHVKRQFFNRRIGSHVEIYDGGGIVWSGLIWEMESYANGVLRRISLDKVRNAIKCVYTDQDDDSRNETAYFLNDESIARYGRIEEIVYLDKTYLNTANLYAQTILTELQWPISRVVTTREPKVEELEQLRVKCVGYTHTINYQYVTIDESARTIGGSSGAIADALSADSTFVKAGSIADNAILVRIPDTDVRVLDWIMELTEIGDGLTPYRFHVYRDKLLAYAPISNEPTIFWDGRDIRSSTNRSALTQRYYVKPGMMRDTTWTSANLVGSFYQNKTDSLVSEVEAGMNYKLPTLKADDYNDSDLMAAMLQNEIEFQSYEEED